MVLIFGILVLQNSECTDIAAKVWGKDTHVEVYVLEFSGCDQRTPRSYFHFIAPFLSHQCHGLGNGSIAFIRKLPTVQARYLVGNYTEQEEKTRAQPEAGVLAAC